VTVTDRLYSQFHIILPSGTQVVTRVEVKGTDGRLLAPRGAVGEIVKAPDDGSHSYRVRFVNGAEASLRRHEMTIRKQYQREAAQPGEDLLAEYDLYDFVIYRCVVGSRAFGLAGEDSDIDRRGIYLPPADLQWSLYGAPEQLENEATQECYWELRKFLILALKANPNILECLYTPLVETATPIAQELLAMREIFLSKLVYQTYNGYVMSQFKKLEQDLRSTGAIKLKHAMHLIRLLMAGVTVLKEGFVPVNVGARRDLLLAIKRGEMDWQEINKLRLSLHKDFDAALDATKLPERPDYERANAFLVSARRAMAQAADA
jgi:predicted nucleotidyltransferase